MLPFLAILRHDIRASLASWTVRLWLVGTVLLTMFLMMANWGNFQTAPMIASLLFPYLVFPWFLVVIVLGVTSVSGAQAETLADGILSRPVTRYEYLLASWLARLLVVLSVYLVVIVPTVWLLKFWERPVRSDSVTLYGIAAAMTVVGLVMTFQVSIAFLLGTVLRRPILALVLLIFLWYPVNSVLHAFQLEQFSPISLSQAMPTLLRQPWRERDEKPPLEMNDEEMAALARQAAQFINVLSGSESGKSDQSDQPFFDREEFDDFSLTRVFLGYGIPTLLAVTFATLSFCRRDF